LRLFCFPYAGGGASVFSTWWRHVSDEVELLAVQLPGREDHYRQPPLRRMSPLVEALLPQVTPLCDVPFGLLGHSMGGLIAFELARRLRRSGHPLPACLAVSGRRAPQLPDPLPPIPNLPDEEFVEELQRRYRAVPEVIARDPQLRAIFLPTVRADLELVDTYVYSPEPPLDCPILAFGGTEDAVAPDELAAWQAHTKSTFRVQMLPGNHFFINTQARSLLRLVVDEVQAELRR
jgi:medium-chain acyl-[acyl-carrier-protein] hydrolase